MSRLTQKCRAGCSINVLPCGFILSFRSTIILCAVFAPIPLTLLSLEWSPYAITVSSSGADIDDNIMRAVDAPTPDTASNSRNRERSRLSMNPNSTCASSLMASCTNSFALLWP